MSEGQLWREPAEGMLPAEGVLPAEEVLPVEGMLRAEGVGAPRRGGAPSGGDAPSGGGALSRGGAPRGRGAPRGGGAPSGGGAPCRAGAPRRGGVASGKPGPQETPHPPARAASTSLRSSLTCLVTDMQVELRWPELEAWTLPCCLPPPCPSAFACQLPFAALAGPADTQGPHHPLIPFAGRPRRGGGAGQGHRPGDSQILTLRLGFSREAEPGRHRGGRPRAEVPWWRSCRLPGLSVWQGPGWLRAPLGSHRTLAWGGTCVHAPRTQATRSPHSTPLSWPEHEADSAVLHSWGGGGGAGTPWTRGPSRGLPGSASSLPWAVLLRCDHLSVQWGGPPCSQPPPWGSARLRHPQWLDPSSVPRALLGRGLPPPPGGPGGRGRHLEPRRQGLPADNEPALLGPWPPSTLFPERLSGSSGVCGVVSRPLPFSQCGRSNLGAPGRGAAFRHVGSSVTGANPGGGPRPAPVRRGCQAAGKEEVPGCVFCPCSRQASVPEDRGGGCSSPRQPTSRPGNSEPTVLRLDAPAPASWGPALRPGTVGRHLLAWPGARAGGRKSRPCGLGGLARPQPHGRRPPPACCSPSTFLGPSLLPGVRAGLADVCHQRQAQPLPGPLLPWGTGAWVPMRARGRHYARGHLMESSAP